jgi:three-Cys-motif partner protein
MKGEEHRLGGLWTDEKLDRVSKYLQAYTTALKNQPFQLMYIDAFAGTGYRASKRTGQTARGFFPLPQMADLAKGSARRALDIRPAFDRYVFIEANPGRFQELNKLKDEFPSMRDRMTFRNEEANAAILDISSNTDWRRTRAVLFLDPYGMQVNWTTIEAIGRAQYTDLWYLFPAGTVQRLLQREGNISAGWQSALDRFLGDASWRSEFYKTVREPTLFGDRIRASKVADLSAIESYIRERLGQVFHGGVAQNALQLRNSKGSCMYLLLFACGNPGVRAHRLALKIAGPLLNS